MYMKTFTIGTVFNFSVTEWALQNCAVLTCNLMNCQWLAVENWNMHEETIKIKCVVINFTCVLIILLREMPNIFSDGKGSG